MGGGGLGSGLRLDHHFFLHLFAVFLTLVERGQLSEWKGPTCIDVCFIRATYVLCNNDLKLVY